MVGAIASDICFLVSVGEPANLVFLLYKPFACYTSMTYTTDIINSKTAFWGYRNLIVT
jgi:hypothetical protein